LPSPEIEDAKRRLAMDEDLAAPPVIAFAETGIERATEPHRHARGQLIACARGVLWLDTEAGAWVVPAQHAAWLPPWLSHGGRTHGPASGWTLYVAEVACARLPPHPCTLAIPPLLWQAALRVAAWGLEPLDQAQARIAELIVDEIAALAPQPLGLPMPHDPRLRRVAGALLADPADRRGLEAWADWAGLSTRTLSRRFVVETSLSFKAWRQRALLMRALERLAEGAAVTTVALDLGYANPSAFIALFKHTLGATPAAYFGR
jgi:AraC-like DNA-binding protein